MLATQTLTVAEQIKKLQEKGCWTESTFRILFAQLEMRPGGLRTIEPTLFAEAKQEWVDRLIDGLSIDNTNDLDLIRDTTEDETFAADYLD